MNETTKSARDVYWQSNLKLLAILLVIWFAVSFGAGILFVDALDGIRVGGFKLGFWFSQQGSIYVFVALVIVYVRKMNALDRTLTQQRREAEAASPADSPSEDPKPAFSGAAAADDDGAR